MPTNRHNILGVQASQRVEDTELQIGGDNKRLLRVARAVQVLTVELDGTFYDFVLDDIVSVRISERCVKARLLGLLDVTPVVPVAITSTCELPAETINLLTEHDANASERLLDSDLQVVIFGLVRRSCKFVIPSIQDNFSQQDITDLFRSAPKVFMKP